MVFSDEMGVTVNVAGTVNASSDDCGTQPGHSLPCAHPPLGVLWWLKQSATQQPILCPHTEKFPSYSDVHVLCSKRERAHSARCMQCQVARAVAVPTNDVQVRERLRAIGEPICFFGESVPITNTAADPDHQYCCQS